MGNDWPRSGPYVRSHWQPERPAVEHIPDDGRFYEQAAIRAPPMPIDKALREHCQINAQSYFLAVVTDEGEVAYFSGPERLPKDDVPHLFQIRKFLQYQKRAVSALPADAGLPYDDLYYQRDAIEYSRRPRVNNRYRSQLADLSDDDAPVAGVRNRKRHRVAPNRRGPDDDEPPVITRSKKGIRIGNSDEVWDFYGQRFRNIQQNACKLIAKIWVKAVAPKKQTHNPYTAGDEKAPDWWPKPWGPTREDKVRHVEPDHLLKKERVHLLIHILRLIIEPNATQHPDIQKLGLNVAKLEELTMESLSGFFNDNGKNGNAKKKPYLKEIFKVARTEEQYKRGEIDAGTEVFVMSDEKTPETYQSDREDDGDEGSVRSSRVSPPKTTSAAHSVMSASSSGHSPVPSLRSAAPFMGDIPVRGAPYQPAMMHSDLAAGPGQNPYVENANMGVGPQPAMQSHGAMHMPELMPAAHEAARRTTPMFSSAGPEFPNASGAGLYAGSWQQTTTGPASAALYAFNTQQQGPTAASGGFVTPPGVAISQGSQYLGSQFHNLPSPGDVYRGGAVAQNSVGPAAGYQGYLTHDGSSNIKMDPINRNSIH